MQNELQLEQGQVPAPGYYWVSINGAAPRPASVTSHGPSDDDPSDDGIRLDVLPNSQWKLTRLWRHSTVRFWLITPPEV
jgi:hypothetical protein